MKKKIDPAISAEDLIRCGTPYYEDEWNTNFIARRAKKGAIMRVTLSEGQQRIIEDSNKRMNELIAEINDAINKKLESIPRECRFVQINLTYHGEVVQKLIYDIDHDVKRK